MLPHHANTRPASLSRYTVHSSDVIADLKVNVLEENSDKVLWYKERFLSDDEIVEHIIDSPTSTVKWTIHRPKRGWYIKIRAPSFPPGVFIPFIPLTQTSPYYTDGSLSFICRTNAPSPTRTHISTFSAPVLSLTSSEERASIETDISSVTTHSYPPSPPPTITVHPPLPPILVQEHENLPPLGKRRPPFTCKTQFILSPHSSALVPVTPDASLLSRALALFKNNQPSHSCSFTISPVPPELSPPPYAPNIPLTTRTTSSSSPSHLTLPSLQPLLTFHDRTPLLTVRSVTGYIEIDKTTERSMGIHTSFWIAVALTYLGFLEDRESYLAALHD